MDGGREGRRDGSRVGLMEQEERRDGGREGECLMERWMGDREMEGGRVGVFDGAMDG